VRFGLFGCRKFRFLQNDAHDRALSNEESRFLEQHRLVCVKCAEAERQSAYALNMLRMTALEPEPEMDPHFEERVLRLLKVRKLRSSLNYWTPAVAGFAVAGFALVAALQMIAQPTKLPNVVPHVEVRREVPGPFFPELVEEPKQQREEQ
jgi:hypothetical protein